MKAILQRVKKAEITINSEIKRNISQGLVVLLGVAENDTEKQADFLADKTVNLRIFSDENDKMNLSLSDIDGDMLIVSNFTLCADCSHGRRPAFTNAARPEPANKLYEHFVAKVKEFGVKNVMTGEFGAYMLVSIDNDGPVTIILDTDEIMKKA